MDFRLFLLRHSEVLRLLIRWTIRVLVPAPFARAIRTFGQAPSCKFLQRTAEDSSHSDDAEASSTPSKSPVS